jgi:hypothetical protein
VVQALVRRRGRVSAAVRIPHVLVHQERVLDLPAVPGSELRLRPQAVRWDVQRVPDSVTFRVG